MYCVYCVCELVSECEVLVPAFAFGDGPPHIQLKAHYFLYFSICYVCVNGAWKDRDSDERAIRAVLG